MLPPPVPQPDQWQQAPAQQPGSYLASGWLQHPYQQQLHQQWQAPQNATYPQHQQHQWQPRHNAAYTQQQLPYDFTNTAQQQWLHRQLQQPNALSAPPQQLEATADPPLPPLPDAVPPPLPDATAPALPPLPPEEELPPQPQLPLDRQGEAPDCQPSSSSLQQQPVQHGSFGQSHNYYPPPDVYPQPQQPQGLAQVHKPHNPAQYSALQYQQQLHQQQQYWGQYQPAAADQQQPQPAWPPDPARAAAWSQPPQPALPLITHIQALGAQPLLHQPSSVAPPSLGPSQQLSPPPQQQLVEAAALFCEPGRRRRPKRFVVLLRGLPGSGKTHIARRMRELEAQHGAPAPRIHSIDDYFVTEVEREVQDEERKGKKRTVHEMKYCFEAEMEDVYRASLLKAVCRTLEEGSYAVVIVDAANASAADLKEYWAAAQRAVYEVYVLQPLESDVEVCFKRNVHGRSREDIAAMAQRWQPAPPFYPHLSAASLFNSQRRPQGIQEVDMQEDSEADSDAEVHGTGVSPTAAATVATKSRWAELEDDVAEETPAKKRKLDTAPSPTADGVGRLKPISATRKLGVRKSVTWADEAPLSTGFRIGGASTQQLETVYVLEGLGPPPDQRLSLEAKSFAERKRLDATQVQVEHGMEHKLLHHSPKQKPS